MENQNIITKQLITGLAHYVVQEKINSISGELPDAPQNLSDDYYDYLPPSSSYHKKVQRIIDRMAFFEDILERGFVAHCKVNELGFNEHYRLTILIHNLAKEWITSDRESQQEWDKFINDIKKSGRTWTNDEEYSEYCKYEYEEYITSQYGLASWDEFKLVIEHIPDYAFRPI